MIREAALRIKGARDPSNVDINGLQRILTNKPFKKSGSNLCDALATLTRQLCTEYIDLTTVEPILASRLIQLDKSNVEVRPIGVGEVIRRIIGKCVTKVTKQNILELFLWLASVLRGHKSGSEVAVHAMNSLFQQEETNAVLLVMRQTPSTDITWLDWIF